MSKLSIEHNHTPVEPLDTDTAERLQPATHILHEWMKYGVACEADYLQVGGRRVEQLVRSKGVFELRFENQLGLTAIQPFKDGIPVDEPLYAEVLSRKFPGVEDHLRFFGKLLADLHQQATTLNFSFSTSTNRGVAESLQPPTPLFTFHFLRNQQQKISNALATVLAAPHRGLQDYSGLVPLWQAHDITPDTIIMLVQNPEHLVVPAAASYSGVWLQAFDGRSYAPQQVWQQESEESFDTPENRFVQYFLYELLATIGRLTEEQWWQDDKHGQLDQRKQQIMVLAAEIEDALRHDVFASVGTMEQFPAASQVLMRREGYRQMRELWQSFFCAREPFFAPLQEQIDLRNVAKLYENWVFFKVIRQIAAALEVDVMEVKIKIDLAEGSGLSNRTQAKFSKYGKLLYNKQVKSYGASVRPDFLWLPDKKRYSSVPSTAFDAKFRLKRDEQEGLTARPQDDDLRKMHAYRDALTLKAAIICYPGNVPDYRATNDVRSQNIDLKKLLTSEQGWQGVGAMPMPVE